MAGWLLIAIYCLLFVATNVTNKYVLSVLHFTYPTLFQEWQTLVGMILLYAVANRGYIKLTFDRSALLPWLPSMTLFVLSIYAGSKALSKLVVPAFVTVQNVVELPAYILGNILQKQSISFANKASLVAVVTSAVLAWFTDSQRDDEDYDSGYYWMLIHILSSILYAVYNTVRGSAILLSDVEKLFYCYLFSVISLSPASIILGDIMAARDFPHWYLYRFYIGCILSGVLGASMNLTGICVSRSPNQSLLSRLALAYAKAALVLVSLVIFEGTITADLALSVFLGISAYAVFTVTKTTNDTMTTDKEDNDLEVTSLDSI